MNSAEAGVYHFGDFRLEAAERRLLREGKPVALPPKVFDTLVVLVEHGGHLVEKDSLMHAVWPNTFVEEVNLAVNISAIRKALGDRENGARYIETVPKRGYRFTAEIIQPGRDDQAASDPPPVATAPQARLPGKPRSTLAVSAVFTLVLGLLAASAYVRSSWSRPQLPPSQPALGSMAVLPFRPVGQSSGDRYLELGIADDLINRLSHLKKVVIRPTGAVRKYAAMEPDPVVAGKELKVDAVLEGNIQQFGDRIRVTVRLVSVPDGLALWSGKFDEELMNMFALEDSISERVAEAVIPQLSGEERKLLVKRRGESAEAHQAYLKGRFFWNKRTKEGLEKAVEYYRQAVKIEPEYALAYAGMADSYTLLYDRNFLPADESVSQAKQAAAKAVALDDSLAEAHTSLAYLAWVREGSQQEAEKEFQRAISLDPHYATGRQWYGRYLAVSGRFNEAIDELKQALQDDPLSVVINSNLGDVFLYARQYDRAVAQFQQTLEIEPTSVHVNWYLGDVYVLQRSYDKALAAYTRALELEGNGALAATMASTYKTAGYERAMQQLIAEWKKRVVHARGPQEAGVFAHSIARYYAALGDDEHALVWLHEWLQQGSPHHTWLALLKVDPQFDGLRGDPRFAELLKRAGTPGDRP